MLWGERFIRCKCKCVFTYSPKLSRDDESHRTNASPRIWISHANGPRFIYFRPTHTHIRLDVHSDANESGATNNVSKQGNTTDTQQNLIKTTHHHSAPAHKCTLRKQTLHVSSINKMYLFVSMYPLNETETELRWNICAKFNSSPSYELH